MFVRLRAIFYIDVQGSISLQIVSERLFLPDIPTFGEVWLRTKLALALFSHRAAFACCSRFLRQQKMKCQRYCVRIPPRLLCKA